MENTVEQKLKALTKIQEIDSKLNEIRKVRGDLPEEVQDLEDEIEGYQTRINKMTTERQDLEEHIQIQNEGIQNSKNLIGRYEEQQNDVRNNREYDALTKEVELQELEIQIAEKKIKEANEAITAKNGQIETTQEILDGRKKDLEVKKNELDSIIAETEKEEQKLLKDREKAAKNLEDRLMYSYQRIQQNAANGLAVVNVERGACGGCFNMVPPQRQADIKEKKKIIVCEHCGRILADVEDVIEEEKPKKRARRTTKAKAKA
jgi:predicted  nucleic acid-binding Zn-ribbon protein